MKILYAFGWIPVPVFYTNWLPFKAGGISPCFCIFILEKFRNDEGLHVHELGHIEHAYLGLWVGWLALYFLSDEYREYDEVCQYKKQMKYGLSLDKAAYYLATHYRLDLTIEEAKELLRD